MKLAIFDIDGTLTNTNTVDEECFVSALDEAHSISEIPTDWGQYPNTTDSGITDHIFQEKFGRRPEDAELAKFKGCFVSALTEQYQFNASAFAEIPGASVALNRLRLEPEWAIAIATGCWRESAFLKLRAARIDISGLPASYAEDGLSREEILQAAVSRSLDHYRLSSFGKVVSVGDGVWDVRTAGRLKFSFLGVGSGKSAARLSTAGAKHVIEDFLDYAKLLRLLHSTEIPSGVVF